jgi:hypothetical protein
MKPLFRGVAYGPGVLGSFAALTAEDRVLQELFAPAHPPGKSI